MLKTYNKYLNDSLNENQIKPDPVGLDEIYSVKNYNDVFNKIKTEILNKANKEYNERYVEILKSELISKTISIFDHASKQKIVEVKDIILGNKDNVYYPVIQDVDGRTIKLDPNINMNIFDIERFLEFFENNYIDNLLAFQGKPIKGGSYSTITKLIKRIGIQIGTSQDFIVVLDDQEKTFILKHMNPIKILDERIKNIDPLGEEDWLN